MRLLYVRSLGKNIRYSGSVITVELLFILFDFLSSNYQQSTIKQQLSTSFTIGVGEEASHNIYSSNEVKILDFFHRTIAGA